MVNIMHLRSSGGLFGAENVILALTKFASPRKFKPIVLCFKDPRDERVEMLDYAENLNITNFRIDLRSPYDLTCVKAVREIIKTNKIKILHCHDYKANLIGLLASVGLKLKLISTDHLWPNKSGKMAFYRAIDSLTLKFFDKIIAVSDAIHQDLLDRGVSDVKIRTIYNGVDTGKFTSNDRKSRKLIKEFQIDEKRCKIVGTVGRLTEQKGYKYLLQAAKRVLAIRNDVIFLIVGDGILRKDLERLTENLGIASKVIFTGVRSDINEIYNTIDLFVSTSLDEGLPMVVLEALAAKVPVIATNVGAVSKIVQNGRTGILLEPKDVDALTNSTLELLGDEKKSCELADRGYQLVLNEFSAEVMTQKYEEVYSELLVKHNTI